MAIHTGPDHALGSFIVETVIIIPIDSFKHHAIYFSLVEVDRKIWGNKKGFFKFSIRLDFHENLSSELME